MILVDANLLLYAAMKPMKQHGRAKAWLDGKLNGDAPVGMPWPCLLAFLRIATNPRVFSPAASPEEAWQVVAYWLDCPPVWVPAPTENHRKVLEGIFESAAPRGNLVPDAHLAALAIEHGLVLCSTDGGFARFKGLKRENPLEA